ncbi:MAG: Rieske 2Fe-2S domain-containing protein [Gammaproteobacteria bacterium]|nr:Rieske 2Fe-2S domain-containing protein [Gammaproteobacteria bacterium]
MNDEQLAKAMAVPLGEAHSLPFFVYRDAEHYRREMTRVLHDDWVFVCAGAEIAAPGDYFALHLGGEPLVVLRGRDGQVRALSNVCRHRGTQLLEDGFGRIEGNIVCPYHAWAYEDDGALKAVPLASDIKVERQRHKLSVFAVSDWHGLLFVHLGKAPQPLHERLAGIDRYLEIFELSRFDKAFSGPIEYWDANWKLVMENAMESYHLFKVHAQTLETLTPTRDAYYVAGNALWTLTGGRTVVDKSGLSGLLSGGYPEAFDHYLLISLPPSFVGVLGYDTLGWLAAYPTGPQSAMIRSGGITDDLSHFENSEARAFTEAFFAEDKDLCERVQAGMSAQLTGGGQLVDMERVVVDFHNYLAHRMFGVAPRPRIELPDAGRFLLG